jgi:hypothetical protein
MNMLLFLRHPMALSVQYLLHSLFAGTDLRQTLTDNFMPISEFAQPHGQATSRKRLEGLTQLFPLLLHSIHHRSTSNVSMTGRGLRRRRNRLIVTRRCRRRRLSETKSQE